VAVREELGVAQPEQVEAATQLSPADLVFLLGRPVAKSVQTTMLEDKSIDLEYYEKHVTTKELRPQAPGEPRSAEWRGVLVRRLHDLQKGTTSIVERLEEVDELGRSRREEYTRKLRRLRGFARLVGRLKAAQRRGTGKRLSAIEGAKEAEIERLMNKGRKTRIKMEQERSSKR